MKPRSKILLSVLAAIVSMIWGTGSPLSVTDSNIAPLKVTEIASGIFVSQGLHEEASPQNRGHISNVSFVIGRHAVAVIDTGGSAQIGAALKAAIRTKTKLPIRYVINSHMHPDHIFGNSAFRDADTVFIGHHKLKAAVKARATHYLSANRRLLGEAVFAGTEILLPSKTVEETLDLDLGGRSLRITAHSTAHTDNDITVLDGLTGTLWTGDLLFSSHIPVLDGNIIGWLNVMAHLKEIKATRVVPGHGPATMSWPDALKPQERYLRNLVTEIREFLKQGRSLSEAVREVGRSEKGRWMLFEEFHARNVAAAFTQLEWE